MTSLYTKEFLKMCDDFTLIAGKNPNDSFKKRWWSWNTTFLN